MPKVMEISTCCTDLDDSIAMQRESPGMQKEIFEFQKETFQILKKIRQDLNTNINRELTGMREEVRMIKIALVQAGIMKCT